jgi:hypothetical protein
MLPSKPTQLLAFYLPQYHPIPENDEWWGRGFTEWRNVTKGRPLFRGHYQPHVPASLGYYDLRLPEVREQQAALALQAGLNGFVFFHYWFGGRRLLERPVDDMLRLGKPDFPFCLCWVNEAWSRNWDGKSRDVLMPQAYSAADDIEHIKWLCTAFKDDRYIKINGCPLLMVYRPSDLPDMRETADRWRKEAAGRGFPGLFLCGVQSLAGDLRDPAGFGLDAAVEFEPTSTDPGAPLRSSDPLEIGYQLHRVWSYDSLIRKCLERELLPYRFFPGLCPSWDNSVRRREGGVILKDATPAKYQSWLRELLYREWFRPQKESVVLVNAWNEWAEGNHLEPCERWGTGYIDATRQAIDDAQGTISGISSFRPGMKVALTPGYEVTGKIESRRSGPGDAHLEGWSMEATGRRAPDMVVLAERLKDGGFGLIGPVEAQRIPRPDVAAIHGQASMPSGWKASYQQQAGQPAPGNVVVLALRGHDRSVALVAPLIP